MAIFAVYLAGIRVYEKATTRARARRVTPIVVEFVYKRRVAEVLLDFCLVVAVLLRRVPLRFEDPVRVREELRDVLRARCRWCSRRR